VGCFRLLLETLLLRKRCELRRFGGGGGDESLRRRREELSGLRLERLLQLLFLLLPEKILRLLERGGLLLLDELLLRAGRGTLEIELGGGGRGGPLGLELGLERLERGA